LTGAAKFCLARAAKHAATRAQFGETIGIFEMVKEKLAYLRIAWERGAITWTCRLAF